MATVITEDEIKSAFSASKGGGAKPISDWLLSELIRSATAIVQRYRPTDEGGKYTDPERPY